jgi:hypothetical protein
MDRGVLTFGPHSGGIPGGRSCNYIDTRNGNTYWLSVIPCNSAVDMRNGNKFAFAVFLCDHGLLDMRAEKRYDHEPTAEELSADALAVCDKITWAVEPNAL